MKRRILSLALALMLVVPMLATDSHELTNTWLAYAEDEDPTVGLEDFKEPEYQSQFTFPDELRGIALTPTVDFAANPEATSEEIAAECTTIMEDVAAKGMNAVIINTSHDGSAFYSTDINESVDKAPIELAIQAAKDKGFFVYLTFDINYILGQFGSESLQERIDYLAIKAHEFTVKYRVDGVILRGYYSSKNTTSFDDYMQNGSGIGFDNWLLDNGAYVFSLVSDAIRKTNNTVPVGILLNDVWANYSTNEAGSNTADSFQALTDGYSDTLGYITKGYADFVMLEAEGAISDKELPFEELVSWWAKSAVAANIPLYVLHDNQKICTDAAGWVSPDQLVKQLMAARAANGYKGSAFADYGALNQNVSESTDAVVKFYSNTLNMDTIDNELNIISPTQTTYTTEEQSVNFMGSFDSNFKVYFNDKIIELNEAGNFYYNIELDVGLNTFTIKNKAKTITYNITRKVQVLKSIEPMGNLEVDGQTNINISAIAYRGSTVTASVGGKKLTLAEQEGQIEGMESSSYARYSTTYTTPKGIINKAQNIGQITVYGTYKGKNGAAFNEQIAGGNITVVALPEVPNNADGSLLRVRYDNTQVYDPKSTDTNATPDQARLPAGALDYCVKKVSYSNDNGKVDYYITLSGKRIRCIDVDVLENAPLGSNNISAVSATMSGKDTIIKVGQTVKTPFSLSLGNVDYNKAGLYAVSGFSANSITITFDYSNSVSGDFALPSDGIFSSYSWGETVVNNVNKQTLTLTLKNSGIFAGVTSYYDDAGNLTFNFNGYPRSLSGLVVVIDPGHGITSSGNMDHGGIGQVTDQSVGLNISKRLVEKLSAAGATVYRLPTESQYLSTIDRAANARQYNPDIFISVHGNAVSGASKARGVEAWYFTPWSQPLAASVSASVGKYYDNSVYKDGVNHNRGAKANVFWTTLEQDFASILLEVGFVTNYEEAMAMNNPTHQDGIANAVVKGIQNYMNR